MAIIKQAGQVGTKKVTAETLQDRLNRLSAGQTTNAATAASMGATPQQTAMAGADNRKQAVLKQSVDTTTNLQTAQAKPVDPADMSAAQTAEAQAAQKLASLSGVSGQIGKQAAARLSGAPLAPIARQANATKVGGTVATLFPQETPEGLATKSKSVTDALVAYANAGSNAQTRNDALIELQRLGIPGDQAEGLLETADQTLQRTITAPAKLDLDAALKSSGFAGGAVDLAQTLGVDSTLLATMTMDDIDNLIETKRKEIASKYFSLQTKAAGTGLGAAAAKQNLADSANVAGLVKTSTGAPAIDFTAKVQIGDSEYDAETILKDEEFSGVIEQWLNAPPEKRASIIPADWPLSAWLTSNEKTLKDATAPGMSTIQDTTFAAGTAGHTLTNLPKEVSALYGFTPQTHYTSADIAAMDAIAAKWAEGPLAKAGADSDYLKLLAANPAALTAANASTPEAIKASMAALKSLAAPVSKDDPTTFAEKVKDILKIDPLLLDPANRAKVEDSIKLYTADPDADSWLHGPNAAWYTELDQASLLNLAGPANANIRKEYEDYKADVASFENLNDAGQTSKAFGVLGETELNNIYQTVQADAATGDADAIAKLAKLKALDVSGPNGQPDGKLDLNDAKLLNSKQKELLASFDAKGNIINAADRGADHYTTSNEVTDELVNSFVNKDANYTFVTGLLKDPSTANVGNVGLLDAYQKKIDAERAAGNLSPERASQLFALEQKILDASTNAYKSAIQTVQAQAAAPASTMDEYKARRDALIEQAKQLGNKPSSKALSNAIDIAVSDMNAKINSAATPDLSGVIGMDWGSNTQNVAGAGKGDIGSTNTISAPISAPVLTNVNGSGKGDTGGMT